MNLKYVLMISGCATMIGCAGKVPKADIPATAQPAAEVDRLESDLAIAQERQIDVLSPRNYGNAKDYWEEAKSELQRGKKGSTILESVAYSRGYLDQAEKVATQAEPAFPEVLRARKEAQAAEAEKYQKDELAKADRDLKRVSKQFEDGEFTVNQDDRVNLQKEFLDTQVHAVIAARLGRAKNIYEVAKRNGAADETPKTFSELGARIKEGELKIVTSLRNPQALDAVEQDVNAVANRLMNILRETKKGKNESVENLAIENVNQKENLDQMNESLAQSSRNITQMQGDMTEMQKENKKLEQHESIDKVMTEAREAFSKDEAEVLRDGDRLVIRLRGLKFPFGHSDLTAESVALLKRVAQILEKMPADKKVVVEGHTDAVGTADTNSRLSKERASTVAKYLVTENVVDKDKVSFEGFGYERPLASNKTREGRAENRRVDVIISP